MQIAPQSILAQKWLSFRGRWNKKPAILAAPRAKWQPWPLPSPPITRLAISWPARWGGKKRGGGAYTRNICSNTWLLHRHRGPGCQRAKTQSVMQHIHTHTKRSQARWQSRNNPGKYLLIYKKGKYVKWCMFLFVSSVTSGSSYYFITTLLPIEK